MFFCLPLRAVFFFLGTCRSDRRCWLDLTADFFVVGCFVLGNIFDGRFLGALLVPVEPRPPPPENPRHFRDRAETGHVRGAVHHLHRHSPRGADFRRGHPDRPRHGAGRRSHCGDWGIGDAIPRGHARKLGQRGGFCVCAKCTRKYVLIVRTILIRNILICLYINI